MIKKERMLIFTNSCFIFQAQCWSQCTCCWQLRGSQAPCLPPTLKWWQWDRRKSTCHNIYGVELSTTLIFGKFSHWPVCFTVGNRLYVFCSYSVLNFSSNSLYSWQSGRDWQLRINSKCSLRLSCVKVWRFPLVLCSYSAAVRRVVIDNIEHSC